MSAFCDKQLYANKKQEASTGNAGCSLLFLLFFVTVSLSTKLDCVSMISPGSGVVSSGNALTVPKCAVLLGGNGAYVVHLYVNELTQ